MSYAVKDIATYIVEEVISSVRWLLSPFIGRNTKTTLVVSSDESAMARIKLRYPDLKITWCEDAAHVIITIKDIDGGFHIHRYYNCWKGKTTAENVEYRIFMIINNKYGA